MTQPKLINVPAALVPHVLNYVNASSLLAKQALDEVSVHRAMQKQASDLRTPLLNHMVTSGVVLSGHKQAAEVMLGDHPGTLNLLKAATDKIVELRKELTSANEKLAMYGAKVEPGSAVNDGSKQAGASPATHPSLDTPFVGRRTSEVKASDLPLLKLAGLA